MATEEMFLLKQHLHFAGDIFRRVFPTAVKSRSNISFKSLAHGEAGEPHGRGSPSVTA